MTPFVDHINDLASAHGGIRRAAQALGINAGYLCQLRSGKKTGPSSEMLTRLGVRHIVKVLYIKELA